MTCSGSFRFSEMREAVVAASSSYAASINLIVDIVVNLGKFALGTKSKHRGPC